MFVSVSELDQALRHSGYIADPVYGYDRFPGRGVASASFAGRASRKWQDPVGIRRGRSRPYPGPAPTATSCVPIPKRLNTLPQNFSQWPASVRARLFASQPSVEKKVLRTPSATRGALPSSSIPKKATGTWWASRLGKITNRMRHFEYCPKPMLW
jgi:hypothetical protein